MSSNEARLDKLFPALTAKERAILCIRALKEGRDEDPKVRFTMPHEQAGEFNHYMALFNAVNQEIGFYIILLQQIVEQLDLRFAWLLTVRAWAMRVRTVSAYLVLYTKEPVTESEYQRHLRKARERMVSLSELAEVLTDRYDAWAESDVEDCEGEEVVTDAAWRRVFKEKKKEIAQLVDGGVLIGKQGGKGVKVQAGSFYDWLGEPVPLLVDWGQGYDVYSDDRVKEVKRLQKARRRAQAAFGEMPSEATFDPELRKIWNKSEPKDDHSWDKIADVLLTTLRKSTQMRWWELGALELVLEEANAEFDGEDALGPRFREVINEAKLKVQSLKDSLQEFGEPIELSEPGEEHIQLTKELLDRARGI